MSYEIFTTSLHISPVVAVLPDGVEHQSTLLQHMPLFDQVVNLGRRLHVYILVNMLSQVAKTLRLRP